MGWGKGSTHHCTPIHGYPEAKRYFESRKAVRSKRWAAEERPLVSSTETWFAIKRDPNDDYYDLRLYRDNAVRYFKPEEDGSYRVLLANSGYRHSWRFLSRMRWDCWYAPLTTTLGTRVRVPLSHNMNCNDSTVEPGWSADLWFNKAGLLIREKSDHIPIYTRKSGSGDRAKRRAVLEGVDNVLAVLMLRLPTFHAESTISKRRGGAFGGHQTSRLLRKELQEEVTHLLAGHEPTDDLIYTLLPFAQETYNVALSKWWQKERVRQGESRWSYWGDESGADKPLLSEEKFRVALRGALLRHSGLSQQTENIMLPKFPTELPKKYFFYKV